MGRLRRLFLLVLLSWFFEGWPFYL